MTFVINSRIICFQISTCFFSVCFYYKMKHFKQGESDKFKQKMYEEITLFPNRCNSITVPELNCAKLSRHSTADRYYTPFLCSFVCASAKAPLYRFAVSLPFVYTLSLAIESNVYVTRPCSN